MNLQIFKDINKLHNQKEEIINKRKDIENMVDVDFDPNDLVTETYISETKLPSGEDLVVVRTFNNGNHLDVNKIIKHVLSLKNIDHLPRPVQRIITKIKAGNKGIDIQSLGSELYQTLFSNGLTINPINPLKKSGTGIGLDIVAEVVKETEKGGIYISNCYDPDPKKSGVLVTMFLKIKGGGGGGDFSTDEILAFMDLVQCGLTSIRPTMEEMQKTGTDDDV